MKKTSTTLHILLVAGLLSVTACNDAQQNRAEDMADSAAAKVDNMAQDVKEGVQNATENVKDALNGNADSNFVVDATEINMAELKVLQAGINSGTNKDLKSHAKMMLADHKKLGDGVNAYAAKKGYRLPADDNGKGKDAIDKLNNEKKGADWDKAWVDHMVSAHEDAISRFEKGQNNVKDEELKTMITNALPTLRSHLDMMKQMQDKMGK